MKHDFRPLNRLEEKAPLMRNFNKNTMVFDDFSADRSPKMGSPGIPTDLATPPLGSKRAPEKVRAGPPDPNGAPGTSSRAPGPLPAAPRWAQGGHGGSRGAQGGGTGGSLSFCYTSPLILVVFSKCCCGPCFEHVFVLKTRPELGGTKPLNHEQIVK